MSSMPPGYCLYGRECPWVAVYAPTWNQIWTHPDATRRQCDRALLEEIAHLSSTSFHTAQYTPMFEELAGGAPDFEIFRDLVETWFVASYPMIRGKPLDLRCIPRYAPEHHISSGKAILRIARHLADAANPGLLKSEARTNAIWAVLTFLAHVLPLGSDSVDGILAHVRRIGPPNAWQTAHEVFEHLIREALGNLKRPGVSSPFSLVRPLEPHTRFATSVRVLDEMLTAPRERFTAMSPAHSGYVTLGIASLLPVVWVRRHCGRVLATVEVWDQTMDTIGAHEIANTEMPWFSRVPSPRCAMPALFGEYAATLSSMEMSYDIPLRRIGLLDQFLRELPQLLQHFSQSLRDQPSDCAYCRGLAQDRELLGRIERCCRELLEMRAALGHSLQTYPIWLSQGCMRAIEISIGTGESVELAGLCRPDLSLTRRIIVRESG